MTVERYPAEPTEVPETRAEAAAIEPTVIELEPVERDTKDEFEIWEVDQVVGYTPVGRRYRTTFLPSDGKKYYTSFTALLQAPAVVAAWLMSSSGTRRLRALYPTEAPFRYAEWVNEIRTLETQLKDRIFRVVAIQLVHVKQPSWKELRKYAAFKGALDQHARFTVWMIPAQLKRESLEEHMVIPVTDVPFRSLPHLFTMDEWAAQWEGMRRSWGPKRDEDPVGIHWGHTAEDDALFGIEHEEAADSLPFSAVFET
tara:strand:- start:96 stop:863 length:768 start_codon:yes stop_codon:yes gene_type:complete